MRSHSDCFHPRSVGARGKAMFSVHAAAQVVMKQHQRLARDGLGYKWPRSRSLIHSPGAGDYLQVGGTDRKTRLNHGWPQPARSTDPPEWAINRNSEWKVDSSFCKNKRSIWCSSLHNLLTRTRNPKRLTSDLRKSKSPAPERNLEKQLVWEVIAENKCWVSANHKNIQLLTRLEWSPWMLLCVSKPHLGFCLHIWFCENCDKESDICFIYE